LIQLNLASISFGQSETRRNGWRPLRPVLGTNSNLIPFRSQRCIKHLLVKATLFPIDAKEAYSLLNAATDPLVILKPVGDL
jgi:hypothetical protein